MQNASTYNLSLSAFVGMTALSLSTIPMFSSLSGCGNAFETCTSGECGGSSNGGASGATGNGGGVGGTSGNGGDAGTGGKGGGNVIPGTQYIPNPVRPSLAQTLPPTRAFLLWSPPSAIPDGKTFDHYTVCWTNGSFAEISDASKCPNAMTTKKTYAVIDSLKAGTTYYWKIESSYAGDWISDYSVPFSFSTDDSVVGWWKFDEGTGTSATDLSDNGNDGTLSGSPSWVNGLNGKALSFDGSNYVIVGDKSSLEGMSALTLEAWVKTTSTATNLPIVAKYRLNPDSYTLRTDPTLAGTINFSTYTTGMQAVQGAIAVNDGLWHHVMGTYDGLTQQLYIDLTSDGSVSQTGNINNSDEDFCIGAFCNGGTTDLPGFDGVIDEGAVYNRALNDAERTNSFCATQASGGVDPLSAACQ